MTNPFGTRLCKATL